MMFLRVAGGVVAGIILIRVAFWLLGLVVGVVKMVLGLLFLALAVGIVAFIIYFLYQLITGRDGKETA